MTEIETHWFTLLDRYATSRHNCFLTEFFRDQSGASYVLCFRLQNSERRFVCKYMRLSLEALKAAGDTAELVSPLATTLDDSLEGSEGWQ